MPARQFPLARRVACFTAVLALAVGAVATTVAPAAAATNPPWRFTRATGVVTIPSYQSNGIVVSCPAGYRAVSGGITEDSFLTSSEGILRYLEYMDFWSASYHVGIKNNSPATESIRISVNCLWDNFGDPDWTDTSGDIRRYTKEFSRDSAGWTGGLVSCPTGYQVLAGGAEWANNVSRNIDYTAPHLDSNGHGTGWFASGYTQSANTLGVEVYCLAAPYLAGAYAEVDVSGQGQGSSRSATALCAEGYRILTGGANRGESLITNRGLAWVSGPSTARHWSARARLVSTDRLSAIAICVPASAVSVSITTAPPELTSSRIARLEFSASDQVGEDLDVQCQFSGPGGVDTWSCDPETNEDFGGLVDGAYSFQVRATNESGVTKSATAEWTVDGTRPIVADTSPVAPLGGPVELVFSEVVNGVDASDIDVHAATTNAKVAGSVSVKHIAPPNQEPYTKALWVPNKPLFPGETYHFTVSNAIKDKAGNQLVPTFWDVRAQTALENTSIAMKEWWDVDRDPVASDDSYITSRDIGSSATLTFTATAGQSVSIFGIRGPDGGYADIELDGVKKSTATFYAATQGRAKVFQSAALAAGQHTVSIRVLGTHPVASTSSWVSIDNLTIGSIVRQDLSLRQQFRRVNAPIASGGSYDLVTRVTDADGASSYSATFIGDGVKVYATMTPTSGQARVFVDNVYKQTIDLHTAGAMVYEMLVYSVSLPVGIHTVRIVPVGTANGANSAVGIDRINVQ